MVIYIKDVHVLFITRAERRVVETTDVRSVQIIEEDRVDDLLYRNAANIL